MLKPVLFFSAVALLAIAPLTAPAAAQDAAPQKVPAKVTAETQAKAKNLYARQTYGDRFLVIGPKADGRLLVLILAPKGSGNYYPVSARPADRKERREYREWKAGTQQ